MHLVLDSLVKRPDALGAWVQRRLHPQSERNVVIVALAAKLARIAWELLSKGQHFNPPAAAA